MFREIKSNNLKKFLKNFERRDARPVSHGSFFPKYIDHDTEIRFSRVVSKEKLTKRGLVSLFDYSQKVRILNSGLNRAVCRTARTVV